MNGLLLRLRDVVWSAVIAIALAVLSIVVALISPDAIALVGALGLGAVTSAVLAGRE
jgi:hypothetical protein